MVAVTRILGRNRLWRYCRVAVTPLSPDANALTAAASAKGVVMVISAAFRTSSLRKVKTPEGPEAFAPFALGELHGDWISP